MTLRNTNTQIFAALLACLMLASPASARVKVGQPASDFSAKTFDGQKISLADFKGKVLLINIWATWCGPCKKELPLLDAFYAVMNKSGLQLIAITTEDSAPASALKPLQAALRFPLVRNFRGKYVAIDGSVPSNYVIDRAGVVRYAKAGAFDLDDLNRIIVPLLNEPAPAGG